MNDTTRIRFKVADEMYKYIQLLCTINHTSASQQIRMIYARRCRAVYGNSSYIYGTGTKTLATYFHPYDMEMLNDQCWALGLVHTDIIRRCIEIDMEHNVGAVK